MIPTRRRGRREEKRTGISRLVEQTEAGTVHEETAEPTPLALAEEFLIDNRRLALFAHANAQSGAGRGDNLAVRPLQIPSASQHGPEVHLLQPAVAPDTLIHHAPFLAGGLWTLRAGGPVANVVFVVDPGCVILRTCQGIGYHQRDEADEERQCSRNRQALRWPRLAHLSLAVITLTPFETTFDHDSFRKPCVSGLLNP